jgi:hypothetical protein
VHTCWDNFFNSLQKIVFQQNAATKFTHESEHGSELVPFFCAEILSAACMYSSDGKCCRMALNALRCFIYLFASKSDGS